MSEVVNVSWPGQHIAEDATHRLVTDAQIEKWNKIDRISEDAQYIELTPENIRQYTCTKADEYWTDMGLADGTIFDSSSLDEGNYIIKLGMDKLIKNPNVSAPNFRFGKEGYTYADYLRNQLKLENGEMTQDDFDAWLSEMNDSLGYQAYVNYTIETNTFLFLCMFFGQELSLVDLLDYIDKNHGCRIVLSTKITNSDETYGKTIEWPEAIRIKIIKEPYGPENNMYVLKRYMFFDMCITDYFKCYNYKLEYLVEAQSLTNQDYGIAVAASDESEGNGFNISDYEDALWVPCEFTGVPLQYISTANSAVPYYTTTLTSKTSKEYILYYTSYFNSMIGPPSQIYNTYDSIYIHPNQVLATDDIDIVTPSPYGPPFGYNETYINHMGIAITLYNSFQYQYDGINYYEIGYSSPGTALNARALAISTGEGGELYTTEITSTSITGTYYRKSNSQTVLCINKSNFYYRALFSDKELSFTKDGLDAEFTHPLKLKINDATTVSYNNTEDVTVDLTALDPKNTKVTNWNSALTPGHYYSDLDATNAPYNEIPDTVYVVPRDESHSANYYYEIQTYGFAGSVECVTDKCIIQHLYSTTNCDMDQYIRKAVYDPNNTIVPDITTSANGWKFGEWFKIEYSINGITIPSQELAG